MSLATSPWVSHLFWLPNHMRGANLLGRHCKWSITKLFRCTHFWMFSHCFPQPWSANFVLTYVSFMFTATGFRVACAPASSLFHLNTVLIMRHGLLSLHLTITPEVLWRPLSSLPCQLYILVPFLDRGNVVCADFSSCELRYLWNSSLLSSHSKLVAVKQAVSQRAKSVNEFRVQMWVIPSFSLIAVSRTLLIWLQTVPVSKVNLKRFVTLYDTWTRCVLSDYINSLLRIWKPTKNELFTGAKLNEHKGTFIASYVKNWTSNTRSKHLQIYPWKWFVVYWNH